MLAVVILAAQSLLPRWRSINHIEALQWKQHRLKDMHMFALADVLALPKPGGCLYEEYLHDGRPARPRRVLSAMHQSLARRRGLQRLQQTPNFDGLE